MKIDIIIVGVTLAVTRFYGKNKTYFQAWLVAKSPAKDR